MIPVVTAFLVPADYGKWSTYQALLNATACLVGLNLQSNITRHYFRVSRDDLSKLLAHLLMTLAASTLLIGSVFLLAGSWSTAAGIEVPWLLALPAVAAFQTLTAFNLTLLRLAERPWSFAGQEIGIGLIFAAILYTLLIHGQGWTSQVISLCVATSVFALISAIQLGLRYRPWHAADAACFRSILAISLPQVPNMLATFSLAMSDRLLIQHYLGLEAVGVYGMAYNLGMLMQALCDSVFKAWSPTLYRSLADPSVRPKVVVHQVRGVLLGLLGMAAAYVLALKPVAKWLLAPSYWPALDIVWVIVASYWVRSLYQVGHALLIHVGNTQPLIRANIIAAFANIALNLWLLPHYGIEAAAWNTLAGFAIATLITLSHQQRLFPLPWRELFR